MGKGIRILSLIVLVAALLGTSACATLTTGNSQSLTINTEPTGATCSLSRGGSTIAIVNPTPGTVTVSKSMKTITVICNREGYQESSGVLTAKFQGMTLGNILLGGLVGLAIDVGSGAMARYDPVLAILLTPQEFASSTERDAFFDKMRADCIAEIAKDQGELSRECSGDETDSAKRNACEAQKKALESDKEKRIAEIERKRTVARVKISAQAEQPVAEIRTHEEQSTAAIDSVASATENLEEEINLFMDRYRAAYESADIDRFMSLYSRSAVENGKNYDDIRLLYQKNFENGSRYTYILKNPQIQKGDKDITLTGTYNLVRAGEPKPAVEGNITWTLVREEGTLLIVKTVY